MRTYASLILAVSVCFWVGCSEGHSSDSSDLKDPADTCSANICKDVMTLKVCEGGSYREEPCGTGKKCEGNQCVSATEVQPIGPETCSVNKCKNSDTLMICEGGSYRDEDCGTGKKCSVDQCITDTDHGQTSLECTENSCKNEMIQKICSGGVYVEHPCGSDEKCNGGECVQTVEKCTFHECTDELSETYHACVAGNLSIGLSQCETGKSCLYGSCVDTFEEGTTCNGAEGSGYCTADKFHAVVCNDKHKLAIWTCADECIETDGVVDCPKKARPKPHECENDYKAECINNNNQVRLCKNNQIVTWDCYGGTCHVDSNNAIYCPKNAGVAGLGGIESGGTYDDVCNVKTYQEACINDYYARICDKDGIVRIKPAGDCKISASNPLKVEYTYGAPCDTSDYMPFCINEGKAVGFCAYDGEDLSVGIYKAAQCPSCQTQADAEACMYL